MAAKRLIEPRTGNALTSHSYEAVKLYNEAIDLILGSQSGATRALDRALQLDGDFAVAAAARYFVEKDNQGPNASHYRELAKKSAVGASNWEREHINILFGLIEKAGDTLDKAQAYIKTAPGDLFIISQLSGYLFFYAGPNKLEAVLNLLKSVEHGFENDWAYTRPPVMLADLKNVTKTFQLHRPARTVRFPWPWFLHWVIS